MVKPLTVCDRACCLFPSKGVELYFIQLTEEVDAIAAGGPGLIR